MFELNRKSVMTDLQSLNYEKHNLTTMENNFLEEKDSSLSEFKDDYSVYNHKFSIRKTV